MRRCLRVIVRVSYKGVGFYDINHARINDSEFMKRTREALELIEEKDPRRFKRVQKEIHYIINVELTSGGQYMRAAKCCFVDFGRFRFTSQPEWYLYLYAGLIVHEATHGELYSKGFSYTTANRERIERICHAEQARFLSRVKPEWRDHLVNEFDPSRWHFSWHASKWSKFRGLSQRIKASKKMANNASEATSGLASSADSSSPQG